MEGAKNDDTWTPYGATVTHRRTAEVTAPAGTYKEAGDEVAVDFYVVLTELTESKK